MVQAGIEVSVFFPNRRLNFKAESESEAKEWTDAIQDVISSYQIDLNEVQEYGYVIDFNQLTLVKEIGQGNFVCSLD